MLQALQTLESSYSKHLQYKSYHERLNDKEKICEYTKKDIQITKFDNKVLLKQKGKKRNKQKSFRNKKNTI